MGNKANLVITEKNGVCSIKVSGRANFECGIPLRSFSKNFGDNIKKIVIDLGECESMDSTFMGILTMLSLKTKKMNIPLELLNTSTSVRALLRGLGVEKMFDFIEGGAVELEENRAIADTDEPSRTDAARTVVEAHKTLMNVSLDNIAKFEKVVEFAEDDLHRLESQEHDDGGK